MLEKLQTFARLMIIPTVALYFCGFICITGYLARFGIVTFDIINARFLIAGLHAFLPTAIAIWLSWKVYKDQQDRQVYTFVGSLKRFGIYFELLITPSVAATGLYAIYSAADFDKMSSPDVFRFGPLGPWDVVGSVFNWLGWNVGFGVKLAFYLGFYGVVIIVPIFMLLFVLLSRRKMATQASGQLPSTAAPGPVEAPTPKIARFFLNKGVVPRAIVLTVDIVSLSTLLAAAIYSYWRICSELLDADSLTNLSINSNLLSAWLYTTTLSILMFLLALPAGTSQLSFSNLGSWLSPSNFVSALQRLAAPVLAALFLFGATVFPRLPVAIGGGIPREVAITLKSSSSQFLSGRKYLLGESGQFFFVVQLAGTKRRAYQINKDSVEALETWQSDITPAPKSKAKP